MKLILTAAVDKLGIAGDVVDVKDGYARNFLVPRGFAMRWTRGAESQIADIKRARDAREVRNVEHAHELRDQIEGLEISIPVKSGQNGKLFGAVTHASLASAIKKAGGPSVDKRAIEVGRPIKSVGAHKIGVKLHDAVTAHIAVEVVAA